MLLHWITSWYQHTPSQESLRYEAIEKSDDWVEIHLPETYLTSLKAIQPSNPIPPVISPADHVDTRNVVHHAPDSFTKPMDTDTTSSAEHVSLDTASPILDNVPPTVDNAPISISAVTEEYNATIPVSTMIEPIPTEITTVLSLPPALLPVKNEIVTPALSEKKLSRQEKRAQARFAMKDKKKQDRTTAMIMHYGVKSCHPPHALSMEH